MDRRIIYLIIFIVSVVIGLWVKLQRQHWLGIHSGLDVLLGSGLSFLYVTGLVSGYVTFANSVQNKKLSGLILGLSCGALLWELHQLVLPRMYFDWYDILAIVMAFVFLLLLQRYKPVQGGSSLIGDQR